MQDAHIQHCRQVTYVVAAGALLAMFAMPLIFGFRTDLASFVMLYVLVATLLAFIPYAVWRRMEPLRSVLETTALGLLMTLPVLVFSYAAMRCAFPLADATLMAADRALGFDWPAFIRWVDRSPLLAKVLSYGYSSFSFQLLLLPIVLASIGFQRRAYQLILGYVLLCSAAILISTPFPAVGAYEGYGVDGRTLANVNAHFGYFFLDSFTAVREDADFTLKLGSAAGIITFPSIHAGVALLCAWAAWPSKLLRVPFLLLNLLMTVSAITNGAHYLVDVLAGLAVAAAAIALVLRITTLAAPRSAAASAPRHALVPSFLRITRTPA